tara:strand:+ start:139 stop:330 length:192 start_codon:yes stop_codon:yes gene_type:complete
MISLGFEKKIAKIVMKIIDNTLGKKFPVIDRLTDIFQEQDQKFKELEREIEAIKSILKDMNNE